MIENLFDNDCDYAQKVEHLKKVTSDPSFLETMVDPSEFLNDLVPLAHQIFKEVPPDSSMTFGPENEIRVFFIRLLSKFDYKNYNNPVLFEMLYLLIRTENIFNRYLTLKVLFPLLESSMQIEFSTHLKCINTFFTNELPANDKLDVPRYKLGFFSASEALNYLKNFQKKYNLSAVYYEEILQTLAMSLKIYFGTRLTEEFYSNKKIACEFCIMGVNLIEFIGLINIPTAHFIIPFIPELCYNLCNICPIDCYLLHKKILDTVLSTLHARKDILFNLDKYFLKNSFLSTDFDPLKINNMKFLSSLMTDFNKNMTKIVFLEFDQRIADYLPLEKDLDVLYACIEAFTVNLSSSLKHALEHIEMKHLIFKHFKNSMNIYRALHMRKRKEIKIKLDESPICYCVDCLRSTIFDSEDKTSQQALSTSTCKFSTKNLFNLKEMPEVATEQSAYSYENFYSPVKSSDEHLVSPISPNYLSHVFFRSSNFRHVTEDELDYKFISYLKIFIKALASLPHLKSLDWDDILILGRMLMFPLSRNISCPDFFLAFNELNIDLLEKVINSVADELLIHYYNQTSFWSPLLMVPEINLIFIKTANSLIHRHFTSRRFHLLDFYKKTFPLCYGFFKIDKKFNKTEIGDLFSFIYDAIVQYPLENTQNSRDSHKLLSNSCNSDDRLDFYATSPFLTNKDAVSLVNDMFLDIKSCDIAYTGLYFIYEKFERTVKEMYNLHTLTFDPFYLETLFNIPVSLNLLVTKYQILINPMICGLRSNKKLREIVMKYIEYIIEFDNEEGIMDELLHSIFDLLNEHSIKGINVFSRISNKNRESINSGVIRNRNSIKSIGLVTSSNFRLVGNQDSYIEDISTDDSLDASKVSKIIFDQLGKVNENLNHNKSEARSISNTEIICYSPSEIIKVTIPALIKNEIFYEPLKKGLHQNGYTSRILKSMNSTSDNKDNISSILIDHAVRLLSYNVFSRNSQVESTSIIDLALEKQVALNDITSIHQTLSDIFFALTFDFSSRSFDFLKDIFKLYFNKNNEGVFNNFLADAFVYAEDNAILLLKYLLSDEFFYSCSMQPSTNNKEEKISYSKNNQINNRYGIYKINSEKNNTDSLLEWKYLNEPSEIEDYESSSDSNNFYNNQIDDSSGLNALINRFLQSTIRTLVDFIYSDNELKSNRSLLSLYKVLTIIPDLSIFITFNNKTRILNDIFSVVFYKLKDCSSYRIYEICYKIIFAILSNTSNYSLKIFEAVSLSLNKNTSKYLKALIFEISQIFQLATNIDTLSELDKFCTLRLFKLSKDSLIKLINLPQICESFLESISRKDEIAICLYISMLNKIKNNKNLFSDLLSPVKRYLPPIAVLEGFSSIEAREKFVENVNKNGNFQIQNPNSYKVFRNLFYNCRINSSIKASFIESYLSQSQEHKITIIEILLNCVEYDISSFDFLINKLSELAILSPCNLYGLSSSLIETFETLWAKISSQPINIKDGLILYLLERMHQPFVYAFVNYCVPVTDEIALVLSNFLNDFLNNNHSYREQIVFSKAAYNILRYFKSKNCKFNDNKAVLLVYRDLNFVETEIDDLVNWYFSSFTTEDIEVLYRLNNSFLITSKSILSKIDIVESTSTLSWMIYSLKRQLCFQNLKCRSSHLPNFKTLAQFLKDFNTNFNNIDESNFNFISNQFNELDSTSKVANFLNKLQLYYSTESNKQNSNCVKSQNTSSFEEEFNKQDRANDKFSIDQQYTTENLESQVGNNGKKESTKSTEFNELQEEFSASFRTVFDIYLLLTKGVDKNQFLKKAISFYLKTKGFELQEDEERITYKKVIFTEENRPVFDDMPHSHPAFILNDEEVVSSQSDYSIFLDDSSSDTSFVSLFQNIQENDTENKEAPLNNSNIFSDVDNNINQSKVDSPNFPSTNNSNASGIQYTFASRSSSFDLQSKSNDWPRSSTVVTENYIPSTTNHLLSVKNKFESSKFESTNKVDKIDLSFLLNIFSKTIHLVLDFFCDFKIYSKELVEICKANPNSNFRYASLYYLCLFEPSKEYFEDIFKLNYHERKYAFQCLQLLSDRFGIEPFIQGVKTVLRSEMRFRTTQYILIPYLLQETRYLQIPDIMFEVSIFAHRLVRKGYINLPLIKVVISCPFISENFKRHLASIAILKLDKNIESLPLDLIDRVFIQSSCDPKVIEIVEKDIEAKINKISDELLASSKSFDSDCLNRVFNNNSEAASLNKELLEQHLYESVTTAEAELHSTNTDSRPELNTSSNPRDSNGKPFIFTNVDTKSNLSIDKKTIIDKHNKSNLSGTLLDTISKDTLKLAKDNQFLSYDVSAISKIYLSNSCKTISKHLMLWLSLPFNFYINSSLDNQMSLIELFCDDFIVLEESFAFNLLDNLIRSKYPDVNRFGKCYHNILKKIPNYIVELCRKHITDNQFVYPHLCEHLTYVFEIASPEIAVELALRKPINIASDLYEMNLLHVFKIFPRSLDSLKKEFFNGLLSKNRVIRKCYLDFFISYVPSDLYSLIKFIFMFNYSELENHQIEYFILALLYSAISNVTSFRLINTKPFLLHHVLNNDSINIPDRSVKENQNQFKDTSSNCVFYNNEYLNSSKFSASVMHQYNDSTSLNNPNYNIGKYDDVNKCADPESNYQKSGKAVDNRHLGEYTDKTTDNRHLSEYFKRATDNRNIGEYFDSAILRENPSVIPEELVKYLIKDDIYPSDILYCIKDPSSVSSSAYFKIVENLFTAVLGSLNISSISALYKLFLQSFNCPFVIKHPFIVGFISAGCKVDDIIFSPFNSSSKFYQLMDRELYLGLNKSRGGIREVKQIINSLDCQSDTEVATTILSTFKKIENRNACFNLEDLAFLQDELKKIYLENSCEVDENQPNEFYLSSATFKDFSKNMKISSILRSKIQKSEVVVSRSRSYVNLNLCHTSEQANLKLKQYPTDSIKDQDHSNVISTSDCHTYEQANLKLKQYPTDSINDQAHSNVISTSDCDFYQLKTNNSIIHHNDRTTSQSSLNKPIADSTLSKTANSSIKKFKANYESLKAIRNPNNVDLISNLSTDISHVKIDSNLNKVISTIPKDSDSLFYCPFTSNPAVIKDKIKITPSLVKCLSTDIDLINSKIFKILNNLESEKGFLDEVKLLVTLLPLIQYIPKNNLLFSKLLMTASITSEIVESSIILKDNLTDSIYGRTRMWMARYPSSFSNFVDWNQFMKWRLFIFNKALNLVSENDKKKISTEICRLNCLYSSKAFKEKLYSKSSSILNEVSSITLVEINQNMQRTLLDLETLYNLKEFNTMVSLINSLNISKFSNDEKSRLYFWMYKALKKMGKATEADKYISLSRKLSDIIENKKEDLVLLKERIKFRLSRENNPVEENFSSSGFFTLFPGMSTSELEQQYINKLIGVIAESTIEESRPYVVELLKYVESHSINLDQISHRKLYFFIPQIKDSDFLYNKNPLLRSSLDALEIFTKFTTRKINQESNSDKLELTHILQAFESGANNCTDINSLSYNPFIANSTSNNVTTINTNAYTSSNTNTVAYTNVDANAYANVSVNGACNSQGNLDNGSGYIDNSSVYQSTDVNVIVDKLIANINSYFKDIDPKEENKTIENSKKGSHRATVKSKAKDTVISKANHKETGKDSNLCSRNSHKETFKDDDLSNKGNQKDSSLLIKNEDVDGRNPGNVAKDDVQPIHSNKGYDNLYLFNFNRLSLRAKKKLLNSALNLENPNLVKLSLLGEDLIISQLRVLLDQKQCYGSVFTFEKDVALIGEFTNLRSKYDDILTIEYIDSFDHNIFYVRVSDGSLCKIVPHLESPECSLYSQMFQALFHMNKTFTLEKYSAKYCSIPLVSANKTKSYLHNSKELSNTAATDILSNITKNNDNKGISSNSNNCNDCISNGNNSNNGIGICNNNYSISNNSGNICNNCNNGYNHSISSNSNNNLHNIDKLLSNDIVSIMPDKNSQITDLTKLSNNISNGSSSTDTKNSGFSMHFSIHKSFDTTIDDMIKLQLFKSGFSLSSIYTKYFFGKKKTSALVSLCDSIVTFKNLFRDEVLDMVGDYNDFFVFKKNFIGSFSSILYYHYLFNISNIDLADLSIDFNGNASITSIKPTKGDFFLRPNLHSIFGAEGVNGPLYYILKEFTSISSTELHSDLLSFFKIDDVNEIKRKINQFANSKEEAKYTNLVAEFVDPKTALNLSVSSTPWI